MGRSDDDDEYPSAPLPAHERGWRHPSELGETSWVRSEPPLSIGRGLLATTATVGGVLALAVLWVMLPSGTGGGVTARSTAASPTRSELAPEPTTTSTPPATTLALRLGGPSPIPTTAQPPASSILSTTTEVVAPTSAPADTGPIATTTSPSTVVSSTAPPSVPPPTIDLVPTGERPMAVAVSVGSLILTTEAAVAPGSIVDLTLESGGTTTARVVFIDQGIAVLSSDTSPPGETFPTIAAELAVPGDTIVVLGASPTETQLDEADDGSMLLQPWDQEPPAEGTPVVNEDGELVGLCSNDDDGVHLVPISDVTQLQAAVDALLGARPVWLGATFPENPTDPPTIITVERDGPAANAGLVTGETVLAVEETEVADVAALVEALAGRAPADVVTFVVVDADGVQRAVEVTLGERPPSSL